MDEEINIIRNRHEIIVHYHPLPRRIVLQEAVDVIRHVENDDDQDEHRNGEEKRADEFLEYVEVDLLH